VWWRAAEAGHGRFAADGVREENGSLPTEQFDIANERVDVGEWTTEQIFVQMSVLEACDVVVELCSMGFEERNQRHVLAIYD
jgi:hypothetical protein